MPGTELSRFCYANGCETKVVDTALMCRHHWRRVPAALQEKVWSTHRAFMLAKPGPELSAARERYVSAIREAKQHLADIEAGKFVVRELRDDELRTNDLTYELKGRGRVA